MSTWSQTAIVCTIILFVLTGCSRPTLWYHAHKTQADFNVDNAECLEYARDWSTQHTVHKERMNVELFSQAYTECLAAKGWSKSPSSQGRKSFKPADDLSTYDRTEGTLTAFGLQMELPSGFDLISSTATPIGPSQSQTFMFQGPQQTFFNLTAQESKSPGFTRRDYPVQEPFFVYQRGASTVHGSALDWALYCGRFQGQWVAGLGAYTLTEKSKRLILVITRPLPKPSSSPPSGLRLALNQKKVMDDFARTWLPWLKTLKESP